MNKPPFRPTRREFLSALAAGGLALPLASCSSLGAGLGRRRPNVILIIADQLRACSLGHLGNETVQTPNIDRLAAQGASLRNAFALSPVCSPCRAQILTGRYGDTPGHRANFRESPFLYKLPLEEASLAEILGKAGYDTAFIGKWHVAPRTGDRTRMIGFVTPGAERQGFDHWIQSQPLEGHFDIPYFLGDSQKKEVVPGFSCDLETDWALDYLRARRDRPFFLTLSWNPPHNPYTPPKAFDTYESAGLPLRGNVPTHFRREAQKDLAGYYGLISALDHNVGRVLEALKEEGLEGDTIVVFTSDHGDLLHSHRRLNRHYHRKRSPWSEACQVPLIVRWPGAVQSGRTPDALVGSIDIVPSVLGLAGVKIPDNVQGQDLAPLLRGETFQEREAIFLHMTSTSNLPYEAPWRALRTKQWWYAISGGVRGEEWLLHELATDPLEQRNRLRDPRAAGIRSDFRHLMRQERERLGDATELASYYKGAGAPE